MRVIRCTIRMRNKPLQSRVFRYHVHPIVFSVQNVYNLQAKEITNMWGGGKLSTLGIRVSRTCPLFTCNSSSTQGVKSCNTIILLSGDKPFSFSIPTRTSVSMEALPVIRPIPENVLFRNSFVSTSPGIPAQRDTYRFSGLKGENLCRAH